MKKFLLFAAAAMAVMPAMAEEVLVNGDFSDFENKENQLQSTVEGWVVSGNDWNSRVEILEVTEEIREAYDVEDLLGDTEYFCRVKLYEWNSWMNGTCSQIVETLLGVNDYEFSYLYQPVIANVRGRDKDGEMEYDAAKIWVGIYMCDEIGAIIDGEDPLYENMIVWEPGDEHFTGDWAAVKETVNAPVDDVDFMLVQIGVYGMSGNNEQGGSGENTVQMNVANMSLNSIGGDGVEGIAADAAVKSVKYYGIDGVEVVAPAKGDFVIERALLDNGTVKVSKKVVR